MVTEAPEGGYGARALGESIYTEAETLDDLRRNIRGTVACHLDDDKAPGIAILMPPSRL